jgi:hypothetical protein
MFDTFAVETATGTVGSPLRVENLPAITPGELWLLPPPGLGTEIGSLARHALTKANVIIYDRAVVDLVATILPLGGYAEPASSDGMRRCIQFARDGWSVVRLLADTPSREGVDECFVALVAKLRRAGAPTDLAVSRFTEIDGRLHRAKLPLYELDALLRWHSTGKPTAIAFDAFACRRGMAQPVTVANGLAG